jgi:acylphosphatase
MKLNIHVIISGKVQGVWFRLNTKNKAEQLNLNGWVRNTHDGKVETVFEGEERDVNEMIKWCHEGSPLSNVTNVDVEIKTILIGFDKFEIKY